LNIKTLNITTPNSLVISSNSSNDLDVKIANIVINPGTGKIQDVNEVLSKEDDIEYIVMPGFIDAHNHSRQIALQAFPESGWKEPTSKPNPDEMENIFKWFLLDALKAGVTYICDWPELPLYDNTSIIPKATKEVGLQGCFRLLLEHDKGEKLPDPSEAAKKLENLIISNKSNNIQYAVWIPEENKLEFNRPVLRFLGNLQACLSKNESLFFQMHLAENEGRKKACERALDKLIWEGLVKSSNKNRTVFIHAIWIDERDLTILKKHKNNFGIVTCPKFSDGRLAPIKDILSFGIPIGLGSDTSSSDPFSLIRKIISIHKSQEKSKHISIEEAFYMATLGGAEIFGMQNQIGSIKNGKDADIVLVKSPAAIDINLFQENVEKEKKIKAIKRLFTRNVLRREHIDTVYVKGTEFVKNGEYIKDDVNEEAIVIEGKDAAKKIMSRFNSF
jgi:cytosine/adenosine deaminase-related metal-dependent hydrolase